MHIYHDDPLVPLSGDNGCHSGYVGCGLGGTTTWLVEWIVTWIVPWLVPECTIDLVTYVHVSWTWWPWWKEMCFVFVTLSCISVYSSPYLCRLLWLTCAILCEHLIIINAQQFVLPTCQYMCAWMHVDTYLVSYNCLLTCAVQVCECVLAYVHQCDVLWTLYDTNGLLVCGFVGVCQCVPYVSLRLCASLVLNFAFVRWMWTFTQVHVINVHAAIPIGGRTLYIPYVINMCRQRSYQAMNMLFAYGMSFW